MYLVPQIGRSDLQVARSHGHQLLASVKLMLRNTLAQTMEVQDEVSAQ